MHRIRSLVILSVTIVAIALIGCGDDGTWRGKTPPPLNAGPGVNALYTPTETGGGGGGGSLLGDWFRCRGEGSDPCSRLSSPGLGFRPGGVLLVLYSLEGMLDMMAPGDPYCEDPSTSSWTVDGNTMTIVGESTFKFTLQGDRAVLLQDGDADTVLRQSSSVGACPHAQPDPG